MKKTRPPISILIGIGAFLLIPVVRWALVDIDRQFANIGTAIFGSISLTFLFYALIKALPSKLRWGVVGAGVLAVVAFGILAEFRGFTGELLPTFRWRFVNRVPKDLSPHSTQQDSASDVLKKEALLVSFDQFLGNDRSGKVVAHGIDLQWHSTPPQLLWKVPIGEGWSGLCIAEGAVWTLYQEDGLETVGCFDLLTGKSKWKCSFPGRHSEPMGGIGPRSTPTWYEGKLIVQTAVGLLACLDASDGTVHWQSDLMAKGFANQTASESAIKWGRSGSPLVIPHSGRNLVIIPLGGTPGNSERISLIAYDLQSGEEVWRAGESQISYSSPALMTIDGVSQVVSVDEGSVSGYDLDTGDTLWSEPWPSHSNTDACASQPLAVDDHSILVSKGYAAGAKLIRVQRTPAVSDAPETARRWEVTTVWKNHRVLKTKLTNAICVGDRLYGLNDGVLEAVEKSSGNRIWRGGRFGHGQLLAVNDRLLVTSESGKLVLVDPETGKQLYEQQVLDGVCWNYPAVAGPYVLIRNSTELLCFYSPIQTSNLEQTSQQPENNPSEQSEGE